MQSRNNHILKKSDKNNILCIYFNEVINIYNEMSIISYKIVLEGFK